MEPSVTVAFAVAGHQHEDVQGWYYCGHNGETQGPWPLADMRLWFDHHHFPPGTMVRKGKIGEFQDVMTFDMHKALPRVSRLTSV